MLTSTTPISVVKQLVATDSPLPFRLLIILLIFNSFRPDRLLPGGSVLLYFPTIILLILLLLWIQTPQKILNNPQTKLFFCFFFVMLLGTLLARQQVWAYTTLKSTFLFSLVTYLVMVQFINTNFKIEKYIRLFFVLSLFLIVIGITNKGLVAIPLLADENEFALFSNLLIPIGYFLGQEATKKWKKFFYYIAVIILILGTITSFSRGGFVGLVSVCLFLFIKSNKKIYALFLVGFFILAFILFSTESYLSDMQTIFTEGAQEGTGRERIESWKAGWKMFLDHPILGVGPKNYGVWVVDYFVYYGTRESETMWGRVAHSLYFTLIPETGFMGTLLFALIIWKNYSNHRYITNLQKSKTKLLSKVNLEKEESELISVNIRRLYYFSLGYTGAMIAYLTTGAFISVLWYHYFWMLTSFFVLTSNVAKNIEQVLLERSGYNSTMNGQIMIPIQSHERLDTCLPTIKRKTTEQK